MTSKLDSREAVGPIPSFREQDKGGTQPGYYLESHMELRHSTGQKTFPNSLSIDKLQTHLLCQSTRPAFLKSDHASYVREMDWKEGRKEIKNPNRTQQDGQLVIN